MAGLKSLAKAALGAVLSEYRINWIYASPRGGADPAKVPLVPVDPALVAALDGSPTEQVRKAAGYARAGLTGLAVVEAGRPLCAAHFAAPGQYDRASTWPLRPGEMALMDIVTEESARGRGLAAEVIRGAVDHFGAQGTQRLIAFIWWSNTPSVKAFRKAGWTRIGLSIELRGSGRWHALRIPLGA